MHMQGCVDKRWYEHSVILGDPAYNTLDLVRHPNFLVFTS